MERSDQIGVRVSPRERRLFEAAADCRGRSLSAWVRQTLAERAAEELLPEAARRSDGDPIEQPAGAGR